MRREAARSAASQVRDAGYFLCFLSHAESPVPDVAAREGKDGRVGKDAPDRRFAPSGRRAHAVWRLGLDGGLRCARPTGRGWLERNERPLAIAHASVLPAVAAL
jgi:hypothetical protein